MRSGGEIPVSVLDDTIAQFPTFSEALGYLRALPDEDLLVPADFCAHRMLAPEPVQVG